MAVNEFTIQGLDEVFGRLDMAIASIRTEVRFWKMRTAVRVKATAVKGAPRERGNLAGSAYIDTKIRPAQTSKIAQTEASGTRFIRGDSDVYVGFTASYALRVHENMEMKLAGLPRPSGLGTYWNPGGPKFLTNALRQHERRALAEAKAILNKPL